MTVFCVLKLIIENPGEMLLRKWNWKSSMFSSVLRALVFLVRMAHGRTSGRPKSRAFVDFLLAQFPEKLSGIAAPEEVGSRLITP